MTVFEHAVASFDPHADSVLIWTRLSGAEETAWTMYADPDLTEIVAQGRTVTDAGKDFTVSVEVADLEPATTYWYRFQTGGETSPVGRTRTLPAGDTSEFTMAMVSCARYSVAPLTVYRAIAQSEVDLVLHLGDYIYEDEGDKGPRPHDPHRTAVTLDDYRRRLAQIRTDPDAQALHLQHPMVVMWDDHDFADNAGLSGAKAHDPQEHGDWKDRLHAAVQAHREWLPRRTVHPDPLVTYRSIAIGNLAELVLLDSRIIGRDMQASHPGSKTLEDPTRSLLGPEQMEWLHNRLADTSHRWALVASTVVVNPIPIELPLGRASRPLFPEGYVPVEDKVLRDDQWDGYPAERQRVVDLIAERAGVGGRTVLLSGDVHSSWAFEGPSPPYGEPVCVEVTVPSVSSAPLGRTRLPGAWRLLNRSVRRMDHVHWADIVSRGFGVLQLQPEQVAIGWWFVDPYDTAERPGTHIGASFATVGSQWPPRWVAAPPPILPTGRPSVPEPLPPRPHDVRRIRRWHKRKRFLILTGFNLALLGTLVGLAQLAKLSVRAACRLCRLSIRQPVRGGRGLLTGRTWIEK